MLMLAMAGKSGEGGVTAPPVGADVRTDPTIPLTPAFPTAGLAAEDIFLAHHTVHADQDATANGGTSWTDVAAVENGDLANIVESRIAVGNETGTASIGWAGLNGSGPPSTPQHVGTGDGVAQTNAATDLAVPYPAGVTILANDLLVIHVTIRDPSATTATATGFTALFPAVVWLATTHVIGKFASGGESGTVAVNWDGNAGSLVAIARMSVFRGVSLTDFVEGVASQDSGGVASNPIPVSSLTSLGLNRIGVALLHTIVNRTLEEITGEAGGDYNSPVAEYSSALGGQLTQGINLADMPSPGTISGGSALITTGGSTNWMSTVFALKPSGATGGTGGQRVGASMIYRRAGPNVTITNVAVTQGVGTSVSFPAVALAGGNVALAFLSVNGAATQETNPTSTWVFQSRGNTNAGDDASWFHYLASTAPAAASLTINAGDRWSVIAFAIGPSVAPPVVPAVISQRQGQQSDTGSLTLNQTPVQGNLLVAASYHKGTGTSAVISGTGWTQRTIRTEDLADSALQQGLAIWTKPAGASETTTITTTWTPASTNRLEVVELQANRASVFTFNAVANNST